MEIPTDILQEAKEATANLIPEKSKVTYFKEYLQFENWMKKRGVSAINEEVLLAYFLHLSKKIAPSSMWTKYSMIKATLKVYRNFDITRYGKLVAYLKSRSRNFKPKKAKILERADIEQYLMDAPDDEHLMSKVGVYYDVLAFMYLIVWVF